MHNNGNSTTHSYFKANCCLKVHNAHLNVTVANFEIRLPFPQDEGKTPKPSDTLKFEYLRIEYWRRRYNVRATLIPLNKIFKKLFISELF